MALDYTIGSGHAAPRDSLSCDLHVDTEHGLLAETDKESYRDEPDTPRLPSPPHTPRPRRQRFSLCFRAIGVAPWILVGMILAWMVSALFYQVKPFKVDVTILKEQGNGQEPEQTHDDTLPKDPTPIIFTDKEGNERWTVSIPSTLEFPLKPAEYEAICQKTHTVSHHLDKQVHNGPGHFPYYHVDEKFMNVSDAEDQGFLPTNPVLKYSAHWSTNRETSTDAKSDAAGYCKRSLTYVLETPDAGLGNTLMELWTAYGLAMKENRAFFVDDRNWAYGSYADYFQPLPEQGCLPPAENSKLPCPRHASHLLVTRGTRSRIFGHQFQEYFEDPKKMRVERKAKIFALMREGYEALFHLADSDQSYLDKRIKELDTNVREKGGAEIGVHVRHGDLHPLEFQYSKGFIPLQKYIDAAWKAANSTHTSSNGHEEEASFSNATASKMILASDDPAVYNDSAMAYAVPAQTQIILADEAPLDPTSSEEQGSPWAGGFTAEIFWSLGIDNARVLQGHRLAANSTSAAGHQQKRDLQDGQRTQPSADALQRRSRIARAYLLELAILGRSDRVVCGFNSVGCRLLAVMLGWDRAIEQRHWINVDGQWEWSGIRW